MVLGNMAGPRLQAKTSARSLTICASLTSRLALRLVVALSITHSQMNNVDVPHTGLRFGFSRIIELRR